MESIVREITLINITVDALVFGSRESQQDSQTNG